MKHKSKQGGKTGRQLRAQNWRSKQLTVPQEMRNAMYVMIRKQYGVDPARAVHVAVVERRRW
jgi:hypothetical protein